MSFPLPSLLYINGVGLLRGRQSDRAFKLSRERSKFLKDRETPSLSSSSFKFTKESSNSSLESSKGLFIFNPQLQPLSSTFVFISLQFSQVHIFMPPFEGCICIVFINCVMSSSCSSSGIDPSGSTGPRMEAHHPQFPNLLTQIDGRMVACIPSNNQV